jgi:CBS-domain-containing membrane protein
MNWFEHDLALRLGKAPPPVELSARVRRLIREGARRRASWAAAGIVLAIALTGLALTVGFNVVREIAPTPAADATLDVLLWAPLAACAVLLCAVAREIVHALAQRGGA